MIQRIFANPPLALRVGLLSLALSAAASCGEGTIKFGGGGDNGNDDAKVTVKGNLDDISPVTTRDIVAFVYNVDANDGEKCPCPTFPGDTSQGRAGVIATGNTDFTLSGLESGAIRVVFLLDNPGNDADGQIDAGDPIAILDDVDCEIDDLDGNITVTLEDVDVAFATAPTSDCQTGSPPASGRARANRIMQQRTTTP